MKNKSIAVRLSSKDLALIKKFIAKNEVFNISTLARTSIMSFIKDPKFKIKR